MSQFLNGLKIGCIPTISMLLSSLLFISFSSLSNTNKTVEAMFQSLSAGLILSAVSIDLFPLLLDPQQLSMIVYFMSITSGFIFGIGFLYGMSYLISKMDIHDENEQSSNNRHIQASNTEISSDIYHEEQNPSLLTSQSALKHDLSSSYQRYQSVPMTSTAVTVNDSNTSNNSSYNNLGFEDDWDELPIAVSTQAIRLPGHKAKILASTNEINDCIRSLDEKIQRILSISVNYNKNFDDIDVLSISLNELTEEIDQEIHILQYKLDRCRRLLEGSGYHLTANVNRLWMQNQFKQRVLHQIHTLKSLGFHIRDHLDDNEISMDLLREIHGHLLNMNNVVCKFHDKISNISYHWKKRHISKTPVPLPGSTVPLSLIIPVIVDSIVDGFLIGLSASISLNVGYILATANAIEMSFLGIAVGIRISKCTGSSLVTRYLSITSPPVLMLAATVVGIRLGSIVVQKHHSLLLVGVSFGIVALICLACNELMYEAREQGMKGEDSWINATCLFSGYLLIILLNKADSF